MHNCYKNLNKTLESKIHTKNKPKYLTKPLQKVRLVNEMEKCIENFQSIIHHRLCLRLSWLRQ